MNISIKNLVKTYEKRKVLDVEGLFLPEGKIYGIMGPNGSGKSTLMKMVAGIEKESSGSIFYDGKQLDKETMKKITYVSQTPYLFRASVYDNIAYPLKIRNFDKKAIDRIVMDAIREFELSHVKDQTAVSLSGGESQKVALARALVFKPSVLLLDEPSSNMDKEAVGTFEKAILKENKENRTTVILVTHSPELAKKLCHRIFYLSSGSIADYREEHSLEAARK